MTEEEQAAWAEEDRREVSAMADANLAERRRLRRAAGQRALQCLELMVRANESDPTALPDLFSEAKAIVDSTLTQTDRANAATRAHFFGAR